MKQFNEMGIKPAVQGFVGDKIKIERILNKEIYVHRFKIIDSKFPEKGNGKCLYLQVEVKDEKHLVITSSVFLQDMISKVAAGDFPFATTIVKNEGHLEFT